jgi:DNA-binding phage protein
MTLTDFDPAAALLDEEEIAFFLANAQETGDAGHTAKALEVVERARAHVLTLPPSTDSAAPL